VHLNARPPRAVHSGRWHYPTPLALATVLLAGLAVCGWIPKIQAAPASAMPPPLKVLYLTGGGFHDYEKLVPHLTNKVADLVRVVFHPRFDFDDLRHADFAAAYDAVLYDLCFEEAPDAVLENALQAARGGKPTVMLHCAVHAFRRSPKLREWETCCGMRSKVHDPYAPFTVTNLDPAHPITRFFPAEWKTAGDELYQTISIDPESHRLLEAASAKDGRRHTVCWTYQFGAGRVFATTLGHDLKTAGTLEYQRLVANGLLWACGKLGPDGEPLAGYAAPGRRR